MPIDVISFIALVSQLAVHVILLATSLMVSLGVGWSYEMCGDRCPLGANVHYCLKTPGDPTSGYVLNRTVAGLPEWGDDKACGYVTYSAVVTSVYSVIFMWFVLLRSGWKDVTTPRVMAIRPVKLDTRALVASLLLSLIMSICLLISAVFCLRILLEGIERYCYGIIASFPGKTCGDSSIWDRIEDTPNRANIHQYLEIAKVSSIIMIAALSLHLLLIVWRVFLLIRERLALGDDVSSKYLLPFSTPGKRKERQTQIEVIENDSGTSSEEEEATNEVKFKVIGHQGRPKSDIMRRSSDSKLNLDLENLDATGSSSLLPDTDAECDVVSPSSSSSQPVKTAVRT